MAKRFFLLFLVFLNAFLGYRMVFGQHSVFTYFESKGHYEEMARKLDAAAQRSRELSRQIRLLKSDRSYLEQAIRRRMNYMRDDEVLYIFPESPLPAAGAGSNEDKN